MKQFALTIAAAIAVGLGVSAQRMPRVSFPEGSYSPVTNINPNGFPRVLADGSVMFQTNAPAANAVQIDLGGRKYDEAGVKVVFHSYPGDHEWQVWRKSFKDFAQTLFK